MTAGTEPRLRPSMPSCGRLDELSAAVELDVSLDESTEPFLENLRPGGFSNRAALFLNIVAIVKVTG